MRDDIVYIRVYIYVYIRVYIRIYTCIYIRIYTSSIPLRYTIGTAYHPLYITAGIQTTNDINIDY